MPLYDYRGIDISGKPRTGQIEATDEAAALKSLRARVIRDVVLTVGIPPKPPMPEKTKALLALAAVAASVLLLIFMNMFFFGPPDMQERMSVQDEAIKAKNPEIRYADYADQFLAVSARGGRIDIEKTKAIGELREKNSGKGKTKVYDRKSKVLEEKWVGSNYHVKVQHKIYQGDRTSMGVETSVTTNTYIWKRNSLTWKIHEVQAI